MIDEAQRGALGIQVAVGIPAARVITFLTEITTVWLRPHDALGSRPPARYREQLLAAEAPV